MTQAAEVMPLTRRTRSIGTTRARQTVQQITSGRDAIRQAREYAEQWYQALRDWHVDFYEMPMPSGSGGSTGSVLLTSGVSAGHYPIFYLRTPVGRTITEAEAGRTITAWSESRIPAQQGHGELLERIRQGQGMASLLHHSGRGWADPRARAQDYAVAVLTLAVALGDYAAEIHLRHLLIARVSPTVLVDSQE